MFFRTLLKLNMFKLSITVKLLVMVVSTSLVNGQMVSFGLRKLASSTNQFGLDLMRAIDR